MEIKEIHQFFPIENTSRNGGISIAMLAYRSVGHTEKHQREGRILARWW